MVKFGEVGSLCSPVRLMNKINLLNFLIVPTLNHTLIRGLAFWNLMGIGPDFRRDEWHFAINEPVFTISCPQPSSSLTSNEQLHLEEILKEQWSKMGTSLGCTHLVAHEIIIED